MSSPEVDSVSRSHSESKEHRMESEKIFSMLEKIDKEHRKEKYYLQKELNKLSEKLEEMHEETHSGYSPEQRPRISSFGQLRANEAIK